MNHETPAEENFGQEITAPEQPVQVETISAPAVPAGEAQPEAQPAEAAPEAQDDFQPLHLRRRLRELLSVPERDRNDAQWDEIIELEIQLAPGNRIAGHESGGGNPRYNAPRNNKPGGAGGQQGGGANAGGAGAQQKKHRPRSKNNNHNNRRPRQGGGKGGGEVAG